MANGSNTGNTAIVAILVLVIIVVIALFYFMGTSPDGLKTSPGIETPRSNNLEQGAPVIPNNTNPNGMNTNNRR